MFYEPGRQHHGLPHDPMTALVIPRPIAWVTTLNASGGVNLAPFSFYSIASTRPPAVMISCSGPKDTEANARLRGEFVVNVPTHALREQVIATSREVPPDVSEADLVGVETAASRTVQAPRVKACLVALECRYLRTVELDGPEPGVPGSRVVFGKVTGVFIDDGLLHDGIVQWPPDTVLYRMGYLDYGTVGRGFPMQKPV